MQTAKQTSMWAGHTCQECCVHRVMERPFSGRCMGRLMDSNTFWLDR